MAKSKLDTTVIEAILAGQHPASAWLQGRGSLQGLDTDTALAAIEAASRQQRGDLLEAARQAALDKPVRKAAAAALHRLKSMGIAVPVSPPPVATWAPRTDLNAPPPPMALLGYPDPSGYFPFVLAAHGREESCISVGLAGAGQGFQETNHGHTSRSDVRNMFRTMEQEQALVPVPFHVALHFVQRAFDEARSGPPHGFEHLLESVPEELRESARLIDPLEGQESTIEDDALFNVEALLDPSNGLFVEFSQDDAYKTILHLATVAKTPPLSIHDDQHDPRAQLARDAVDQASDDFLSETVRRTWGLALDVVTFLAWRADKEDVRKAARHNALALRSGASGRNVPFLREWINAQLFATLQMFLSQSDSTPDEGTEESGIILTDR